MMWFPVAFLTNGVYNVAWRNRSDNPRVQFTTQVAQVRILNHYVTAKLSMDGGAPKIQLKYGMQLSLNNSQMLDSSCIRVFRGETYLDRREPKVDEVMRKR